MQVKLILKDNIFIKIDVDDRKYYDDVKELFSIYKDGYKWDPKYNAGIWDGKICLFNYKHRTIPYGNLNIFLNFHKKYYNHYELILDKNILNIFKPVEIKNINWNLKFKPYDYQEDCILKALNKKCGIIRSATASGKSLIISYIYKILFDNNLINKGIIIVPTIDLVNQFYDNLDEYGFTYSRGRYNGMHKELDCQLLISTWQSLMSKHEIMHDMDAFIIDECHGIKGQELTEILKNSYNAKWRLGCTGTLPDDYLSRTQVFSYTGPIIAEYSAKYLADNNYISNCKITQIKIKYNSEFSGSYSDVTEQIFKNEFRLSTIKYLLDYIYTFNDSSILLLVGKVKKEGNYLKEFLENHFPDKEVIFLSGANKTDEREKYKNIAKTSNIILIATYGIFQQGIDIPSLKYLIFVSPFKAKIRILQSIGRALRKFINKYKTGAYIFDIIDYNNKYYPKQGSIRKKYYVREEFKVDSNIIKETDVKTLNFQKIF